MIAGFNGHARVEGRFYSEVRPLLNIEAPVCYHSTYDRQTFAAIHLLEDLVATKSATFCGHKTNVTRAMAEDMVDLLAALHGRFYDAPGAEGVSLARRLSALVQHRRRKDADRALYAKGARCCGTDHSLKTDRATERDLAGDDARACRAPERAATCSCIRTCTSATGTRAAWGVWACATGNAPRADTGRATSPTRSAPR